MNDLPFLCDVLVSRCVHQTKVTCAYVSKPSRPKSGRDQRTNPAFVLLDLCQC